MKRSQKRGVMKGPRCVYTLSFSTPPRTHSARLARLFLSRCGLGCAVSQPTLSPLTLCSCPPGPYSERYTVSQNLLVDYYTGSFFFLIEGLKRHKPNSDPCFKGFSYSIIILANSEAWPVTSLESYFRGSSGKQSFLFSRRVITHLRMSVCCMCDFSKAF